MTLPVLRANDTTPDLIDLSEVALDVQFHEAVLLSETETSFPRQPASQPCFPLHTLWSLKRLTWLLPQ